MIRRTFLPRRRPRGFPQDDHLAIVGCASTPTGSNRSITAGSRGRSFDLRRRTSTLRLPPERGQPVRTIQPPGHPFADTRPTNALQAPS